MVMLTWNGSCASKTPFPGALSGLVAGSGLQHCKKKSDLLSARSPPLNAAGTQAQHNWRWDFSIQHFGRCLQNAAGKGHGTHECRDTVTQSVAV